MVSSPRVIVLVPVPELQTAVDTHHLVRSLRIRDKEEPSSGHLPLAEPGVLVVGPEG